MKKYFIPKLPPAFRIDLKTGSEGQKTPILYNGYLTRHEASLAGARDYNRCSTRINLLS